MIHYGLQYGKKWFSRGGKLSQAHTVWNLALKKKQKKTGRIEETNFV